MECNKEEAIRAKEVAEKKMESKDFVNAKKVAQKAHKLDPDLKDISQMILVCDVHCAAQNKIYGNENDWYGILQVEPTADETAIKKQYRKLALLLHPDKNKLVGAADAFKFVGEAQKVLLDSGKRMIYDRKYKASGTGRYPVTNLNMQQGSRQPSSRGVHSWFQNPFPNGATQFMNQEHQQNNQQTQSGSDNLQATFWTACPFCSVRYQYYKEVLNKTLFCQSCKKSFLGCEMNAPNGTCGTKSNQPMHSQQRGSASHNHASGVRQSISKRSSSKPEKPLQEKIFTSEKVSKKKSKKRNKLVESSESSDSDSSTGEEEAMDIEEESHNVLGQNSGYQSEQNLRRSARSKQHISYDENLSSDDDLVTPSKRSKASEASGAAKVEGHMLHKQADLAPDMVEGGKEFKHKENSAKINLQNGLRVAENPYETMSVPENDEKNNTPKIYEYPDPDFSDFDKERTKECFAAGQIWACYDTLDAMPRFYAMIRKVQLPEFKLQITWLEPKPDDKDEINWIRAGLPVSCGKFRLGGSENCEDHGMFSHLACWEKGIRRNDYKIYPRKGETWAIFKDWNIDWHSDLQSKNSYEFDFVEVLSNYVENFGIQVAYLDKLKDFACLFCRTRKEGKDSVLIPAKQILKFSHKVLSFRMTGKEGKNVPAGSFELDPASLPSCQDGTDASENPDRVARQNHLNGSCSRLAEDIQGSKNESKESVTPTQLMEKKEKSEEKEPIVDKISLKDDASHIHLQNPGFKGNGTMGNVMEPIILSDESDKEESAEVTRERFSSLSQAGLDNHPKSSCNGSDGIAEEGVGLSSSASEHHETPDTIFYKFEVDKSMEKFAVGQIWAVYSDEDALPKYYGRVQKIDYSPGFQLHLTWLESCSTSKDVILWKEKDMLFCCGKFKLGKGITRLTVDVFSHQVRAHSVSQKHIYTIIPQTGEVWALYKDWSAEIKKSELENCQYHIVEVLTINKFEITVRFLEQVDGYKSIFKPQMQGQSAVTMVIPFAEQLRFSHKIPAFCLTEEKDGTLRGCLELDTAAMPTYYFR
ncbi:hypothetical protein M9H77_36663 [Catharanthus roseus]|uniref:Uncharacterized protein n=1 Tax=Catharanthus roseus TaxID=4058 RepID=A0ACB9ZST8_CATRO|nr:hypothetical protein M9H77_36663 [Catharanthus roseus]